jgi:uncharacterized protein (TIGR02452 family)
MTDQCESTSPVNIYPEKRRKKDESRNHGHRNNEDEDGASSPYFEAKDKPNSATLNVEGEAEGEGEGEETEKKKRPAHRQALLSFKSNGALSTRKPLTNPTKRSDAARRPLKDIAAHTKSLLPGLLATRPDVPDKGYIYRDGEAPRLDKKYCPNLPSTRIRVLDSDTIDAALALPPSAASGSKRHPCVLNMANANSPGGGWQHGALAQEEALCYRTSLSRTLKKHYYPLPDKGGIYSPYVLVIRANLKCGHDLLDVQVPSQLPVISAVSVAAVCIPPTMTDGNGVRKYVLAQDKRLMEEKMRVILRIAAKNGHRQVVLGAFGCGAFGNPREEVAKMWAAVLREAEFAGGWWADVVFAVLDDGRGNNFQTYQKELDGLVV